MHNIKQIRENPAEFDRAMARRGLPPQSTVILAHDEEYRNKINSLQELQAEANLAAKEIGALKAKGSHSEADAKIASMGHLKERLAALKAEVDSGESEALRNLLATLPNILDKDVPDGNGEEDNLEIRRYLEPRELSFAKEHDELGVKLGLMDFEQTAKISGARFTTMQGKLARLERALANFMLDIHTQKFGYIEVSPPLMVRSQAMFGTSQLPKFEEDLFQAQDGLYLIPTAEVSLTNMVREMIIDSGRLPLRYTAYTPCFRREAGSAGKDTRGMIRQHQFSKVELVSIVAEEESTAEHERLTAAAEEVLKQLHLPYRVMLLCTKDTGFGSRRTYDIEVWLPGQKRYREISSCSNFGDFQARRMNTRHKKPADKQTSFVHTINGSALAVGRTIIAIMENYQQADGSITIPAALRNYCGFDVIEAVS